MRLFRIDKNPPVLVADINEQNNTVKLHPSIKGPLEREHNGEVALPAIKLYAEEFNTQNYRVPLGHPKYAKAIKIYLENEIIPIHPNSYMWKD